MNETLTTDGAGRAKRTKTEIVGRLVGLVLSVALFASLLWLLLSGWLKSANGQEMKILFLLVILLGGPVPHFFASSATNRLELSTKAGKATFAGGYAVAIFAVLFVTQWLPADSVWKLVELDDPGHTVPTESIQLASVGTRGKVYPVSTENQLLGTPFRFVCNFGPGDDQITTSFRFPDPARFNQPVFREIVISRSDDEFASKPLFVDEAPR